MKFDELRNQPILLFPAPKNEVYFADKDHVWINGRQYISLKRVGEMIKEKRMTNGDRIRAMTDEELANFIGFACQDAFCYGRGMRDKMMIFPFGTHESTLDWLKEEATNG